MKPIERVMACLRHEDTDRVPVYPILSGITRKLTGASYAEWSTNAQICADSLLKGARDFELDCLATMIDLTVECDAWGQKIVFSEHEPAHPDYDDQVVGDIDDYGKIKKADYTQSKRMMMHIEVCKRLLDGTNGDLPIIAFVFGPLGTLSMLRGQQDMYMDVYDDPDAVKAAAREVSETLKDYVAALLDAGVHGIMYDTLFAATTTMSADMWMEFEGVLMKEHADLVHGRGRVMSFHNCGGKSYFKEQIEVMRPHAISFLHPPADCGSFAECKEKYGKEHMLIGSVTPANAVLGSDRQWDEECRAHLNAFKKEGGFMLATGCEYPAGESFNRAMRMIDIAKSEGKY